MSLFCFFQALQAVAPDWLNLDHVIHEAIRDCQTVFKGGVSSTQGSTNAFGEFWKGSYFILTLKFTITKS